MYKQAKPFFMIVQTPLHAGSGQDLGIVDQPIQRERHTSFPKIEGSSLKGAIREVFDNKKGTNINGLGNIDDNSISLSFGPENGDDHAGALGFTDARLLLFPVKSMKGVFAYITCPYVLERFKEDLEVNPDIKKAEMDKLDELTKLTPLKASNDNLLFIDNTKNIILEEYCFKDVEKSEALGKLIDFIPAKIKPQDIEKRLVLLSNDDFKDFVNLSTEVITRTKISPETGTVQSGALFTEEYLPAETVLYSQALTTPIFIKEEDKKGIFTKEENGSDDWKKHEESRVMKFFELGLPEVMQIGGNATIGKGIVRTKIYETSKNGGDQ